MKPIDFRNATFDRLLSIEGKADGQRAAVYIAWLKHGPGTTRERSRSSGIDLLTFRPRTTELVAMGLVELSPEQPAGHEGVYRARSREDWEAWRAAQAEQQTSGQMALI